MSLTVKQYKRLQEFGESPAGAFGIGTWSLSYHDRTHLKKDKEVSLGTIKITDHNNKGYLFFSFTPLNQAQIAGCPSDDSPSTPNSFGEAWISDQDGNRLKHIKESCIKAADYVHDQLSAAMARLGLITPKLDIYPALTSQSKYAVIVLDTSALRTGALRYFSEMYNRIDIWTIIPTVSIMEIGERLANITSSDRKGMSESNYKLLRTRPQVTIAPEEIKWIKDNFPTEILELSSDMLMGFRGYRSPETKDGDDPERLTVNDRLILEGIKHMRRQRNLANIYLMTGDKDMARLASLDGIGVIYPSISSIAGYSQIPSLRYSLEAKHFVSCSIHKLLWDFTHIFSQIKFECVEGSEQGRIIQFSYYYQEKVVHDWYDDILEVVDFGSSSTSTPA